MWDCCKSLWGGKAVVQLGDNADPEAGLLVANHVQFFETGRLGKDGIWKPTVDDLAAAVLVDEYGKVVEILYTLDGGGHLGEGLSPSPATPRSSSR